MAGSFFKLPSYSVFNYQPRYYDIDKDRRENRRRQLRMEKGKDPVISEDLSSEERIRGKISYRIAPVRKSKRNSNLRLFGIIGILLLIVYLILVV